MTKPFLYLSLWLLFTPLLAGAEHADNSHLSRDTHAVLNKTYHLGAVLTANHEYSHLTVDAFKLRNALQHFVRVMQRNDPSDEHIRQDFARVTQAHDHLANVYRQAHGVHHDRHIARDYKAVDRGYYHLERVVRAHLNRPNANRSHSDRVRSNRYDNSRRYRDDSSRY